MKKMLIILAIILLPSLSLASFSVKFQNTFGKKMFYFFYWIDHPFGWSAPANMAGGELEASEVLHLDSSFKQGKYRVVWRDKGTWKNEMSIKVEPDVSSITISPEKIKF